MFDHDNIDGYVNRKAAELGRSPVRTGLAWYAWLLVFLLLAGVAFAGYRVLRSLQNTRSAVVALARVEHRNLAALLAAEDARKESK